MKLNNQQISTLAQEVLNKVKEAKGKQLPSKEEKSLAQTFIKESSKLNLEIKKIEEKKKVLINQLQKNLGYSINNWRLDNIDYILSNKPNNIPSLNEIKHKITLESIFETKESLQTFLDSLIKEFSK